MVRIDIILCTVSFWVILSNLFDVDVLYDSLVSETSVCEVLYYAHVILGRQQTPRTFTCSVMLAIY